MYVYKSHLVDHADFVIIFQLFRTKDFLNLVDSQLSLSRMIDTLGALTTLVDNRKISSSHLSIHIFVIWYAVIIVDLFVNDTSLND